MNIKLVLFMILVILPWHLSYAGTTFIFNPEARISKIKTVKSGLEKYLRLQGNDTKVYIFANSKDFQGSMPRLQPEIAIVASYYFSSMKDEFKWKSILFGHKKGKKYFSKVLVTLKSITNIQQLKKKSLATVALGAISSSYINTLLPTGLSVKNDDIRIVSVSKDIDAIMALGFEQVQAAIVTKTSFNKLKKINPDAVKNLHILQKLNPIQYPQVVIFPNTKNIDNLINIFANMSYKGSNRQVLRFFGITGFNVE
ncbi:MAG: PhnD/SsuA/transferrin family substrate-binding protein [Candidatus Marithrix sp.]